MFQNQMDANLIYVDATDRFLDLLAGVDEPERKRKIIGNEFIKVFEEEARKLANPRHLRQNPLSNPFQHRPVNLRHGGGHGIHGIDRPDNHRPVKSPFAIPHTGGAEIPISISSRFSPNSLRAASVSSLSLSPYFLDMRT